MTNLQYTVFVTSVGNGEEVGLLQIVVIKFTDEDRANHLEKVSAVGNLLFAWWFDEDILKAGIVANDQLPDWMMV